MKINKQLQYFILIGVLAILIDFTVYTLTSKITLNISLSKVMGFITGTIFSFLANQNITFKTQNNIWANLIKFILLYTATLFVNVMINNTILNYHSSFNYQIQIAFFIATTTSAIINFIGMKNFVFIKKNQNKQTFEKN